MLLRFHSGVARRLLAKTQKAPNFIAKIRQRSVVHQMLVLSLHSIFIISYYDIFSTGENDLYRNSHPLELAQICATPENLLLRGFKAESGACGKVGGSERKTKP
jgi:hypothetical protein